MQIETPCQRYVLMIDTEATGDETFCAFINRETGAIREQVVFDFHGLTDRQAEVVLRRMGRIPVGEQTPRVLLKGYAR